MNNLRVPVADASGEIVKTRFLEFLQTFREDENELVGSSTQQRLTVDYMSQIASMMQHNKSTVYVNFQHILEVIIGEYSSNHLQHFALFNIIYLSLTPNRLITS